MKLINEIKKEMIQLVLLQIVQVFKYYPDIKEFKRRTRKIWRWFCMRYKMIVSLIYFIIIVVFWLIFSNPLENIYSNTYNSNKFEKDYYKIQNATNLKFQKLYQLYMIDETSTENYTTSELWSIVATGSLIELTSEDIDLPMTEEAFKSMNLKIPSYSIAADWTLNTDRGELKYIPGYKYNGKTYITPELTK